MQQVTRAVIPAAGIGTRQYPATSHVRKEFFPLVDGDGLAKAALQLLVEEAVFSRLEEVCVICGPDTEAACRAHFSALSEELRPRFEGNPGALEQSRLLADLGRRLTYVRQDEPLGLGHALWCARDWADGEPVLLMLGDHAFVSTGERRCARQVLDAWQGNSITSLFRSGPENLDRYGVAIGTMIDERRVAVSGFVEKPSPDVARERCSMDGLPPDTFLLHFGLHLFTPCIMDILDEMVRQDHRVGGEIQLTAAQDELARRETYEGYVVDGASYDIGSPLGLLEAQVGLALSGRMRETIETIWRRQKRRFGIA